MERKHPSEAMTGPPGALPDEAIRLLILDCRATGVAAVSSINSSLHAIH